ncbi:MAG: hypothetical protein WBO04_00410 [Steroidobacteraceae bacterium]
MTMDAKTLRSEILRSLLQRPQLSNFKLIGTERIVARESTEFVPSIELVTNPLPGGHAVDVHGAIYWRRFSTVAQHVIGGAAPETIKVRPWETACIVVSFGKLTNDAARWASRRASGPADVVRLVEDITHAYETDAKTFLSRCSTAEGLLSYLDEHPDAPGTWRLMLEFLLRERVLDLRTACSSLKAKVPRTEWERRQQSWLVSNICRP